MCAYLCVNVCMYVYVASGSGDHIFMYNCIYVYICSVCVGRDPDYRY